MQVPLEITWHHVDKSEALETEIRGHVEKLEKFFDRIIACRVTVEKPHESQHQGNLYDVRINLQVPNKEIIVDKNPSDNHAHEDVYVALRDAFAAARKQLEAYVGKIRQK